MSVFIDVVFSPGATANHDEYHVFARVGSVESGNAALLCIWSDKDAATTFARYLSKTTANYGQHPDGPTGWIPPIPFV